MIKIQCLRNDCNRTKPCIIEVENLEPETDVCCPFQILLKHDIEGKRYQTPVFMPYKVVEVI